MTTPEHEASPAAADPVTPAAPAAPAAPVAPVALREPAHRVSRSAPWLWAIGAAMRVVVLLVVGIGLGAFGIVSLPWWGWTLFGLAAAAYVPLMPLVRYRIHRWESTETAVYTQEGFLSRQRHVAPMSKVQTIDMDESPVARLFGLATVTVTTASAMGSITITAVDRHVAQQLVSDLTRRTEAEADDAT